MPQTVLNYAAKTRASPIPFVYLLIAQLPCAFILLFAIVGWLMFPLAGGDFFYQSNMRYMHIEQTPPDSTFTPWKQLPQTSSDILFERSGEVLDYFFTAHAHQIKSTQSQFIETDKFAIHIRYERVVPMALVSIAIAVSVAWIWRLLVRRWLGMNANPTA